MNTLKTPLAFLIVIAIWSTTPLAIQWSSANAPFTSVFIRMIIGTLFCLSTIGLFAQKLPLNQHAFRLYVVVGLSIYGSMTLVYWAAQSIPSGWIAVLFGLSPLFTGVFAAFVEPDNKLTVTRILGIAFGIAGLYLVFSASLSFEERALTGTLVALVSVLISSSSSVLIRQLSKEQSLTGIQMTTGGLIFSIPFFALTAWLLAPDMQVIFSSKALLSILYLGIIGSGVGFTLYYYLLKNISASRVALITLITPITALLIGNWLNNEPMVSQIWSGAICVCFGLILYEYKPRFSLIKLF